MAELAEVVPARARHLSRGISASAPRACANNGQRYGERWAAHISPCSTLPATTPVSVSRISAAPNALRLMDYHALRAAHTSDAPGVAAMASRLLVPSMQVCVSLSDVTPAPLHRQLASASVTAATNTRPLRRAVHAGLDVRSIMSCSVSVVVE